MLPISRRPIIRIIMATKHPFIVEEKNDFQLLSSSNFHRNYEFELLNSLISKDHVIKEIMLSLNLCRSAIFEAFPNIECLTLKLLFIKKTFLIVRCPDSLSTKMSLYLASSRSLSLFVRATDPIPQQKVTFGRPGRLLRAN